jgi:hypothetical protein
MMRIMCVSGGSRKGQVVKNFWGKFIVLDEDLHVMASVFLNI